MKIICFGDLHSHSFTDFSEVDDITGNSRLTQILDALDYMKDYAIENGIKNILFAGDLYHKRKSVETKVYNLTFNKIKEFSKSGLNTIMIPGNHDQQSHEDFPEHSLEPFKEIENVTVLDRFEPKWIHDNDKGDIDSFCVFPVPYSKNAEMVKQEIDKYAEKTTNEGLEDKSILLGHLGISGAYVGKSSYTMADAYTIEELYPHAFQFIVLGHFHKYQDLGGHPHAFYTGSPIQHNFGDEGQDKGFWVIDMETRTKELIEIPSPKFITVTDWKATEPEKLEGNFVRYQVDASEVEELSESLPEESKHRIEPQKKYETEQRINVDFSKTFVEIIEEYANEFNPEAKEIGLQIFRDMEINATEDM